MTAPMTPRAIAAFQTSFSKALEAFEHSTVLAEKSKFYPKLKEIYEIHTSFEGKRREWKAWLTKCGVTDVGRPASNDFIKTITALTPPQERRPKHRSLSDYGMALGAYHALPKDTRPTLDKYFMKKVPKGKQMLAGIRKGKVEFSELPQVKEERALAREQREADNEQMVQDLEDSARMILLYQGEAAHAMMEDNELLEPGRQYLALVRVSEDAVTVDALTDDNYEIDATLLVIARKQKKRQDDANEKKQGVTAANDDDDGGDDGGGEPVVSRFDRIEEPEESEPESVPEPVEPEPMEREPETEGELASAGQLAVKPERQTFKVTTNVPKESELRREWNDDCKRIRAAGGNLIPSLKEWSRWKADGLTLDQMIQRSRDFIPGVAQSMRDETRTDEEREERLIEPAGAENAANNPEPQPEETSVSKLSMKVDPQALEDKRRMLRYIEEKGQVRRAMKDLGIGDLDFSDLSVAVINDAYEARTTEINPMQDGFEKREKKLDVTLKIVLDYILERDQVRTLFEAAAAKMDDETVHLGEEL